MKLQEYLRKQERKIRKENKNNDFNHQFLLFCVSLPRAFTRVSRCMRVHSSACKQGAAHPGSTSECRVLRQQHHTHASWYSCDVCHNKNIYYYFLYIVTLKSIVIHPAIHSSSCLSSAGMLDPTVSGHKIKCNLIKNKIILF